MPLLRVIGGQDLGLTAEVRDTPVTIGRSPSCGLKLTDLHVSMIHALVEPIERGHRVRDLESTAGTAVNGQPALDHTLRVGDIITVGETLILFGTGNEPTHVEMLGGAKAPFTGGPEVA